MNKSNKHKMKGFGHINISNPESLSECITLTYALKDMGSLSNVKKQAEAMDKLHDEDSLVSVEIDNYGDTDQKINAKYKVKSCGDDSIARNIKKKLDKFVKSLGGQTTLDLTDDDE
ncbi:hypothetical protein KAR91_03475 [Candidatus Pacearchaeota archaeon]|nr:hypothetical protein [Candidatus Pacearchaeota archaeon]